MTISDKSFETVGLQSIFWKKSRLKLRGINIDMLIPLQQERETDGSVVDQNQVDLRVWNSAGLDYVFDGGPLLEKPDNWLFTAPFNEKIEIAPEAERNGEWLIDGNALTQPR